MLLYLQLWKLESTYVDYFNELFFLCNLTCVEFEQDKKIKLVKGEEHKRNRKQE